MPLGPLLADLGMSTPLTTTQRPFILYVGGTDLIAYADIKSYSLDDKDLTQPGLFTVTFTDTNNAVGPFINRLDEVQWIETGPNRMLFRGFVRNIDTALVATYGLWTITCSDISEMLDYGKPVVSDNRPAETTLARVQHFLGMYGTATSMGTGGFIGALSGIAQPVTGFQRETLRTSIEKSLALEATVTQQPYYYLDYLYHLHVFYGLGDMASPYDLSDSPNGATTVPYGELTPSQDSMADADAVWVYGATANGSGMVTNGVPRWPQRIISMDATASTTPATAQTNGVAELAKRQGVTRAQITVTGYDGWAKGQSVKVTNVVMGWSAVQFWIAGVSMRTLSGTGYRQYVLQLNASLPRLTRISAAARTNKTPVLGAAVQGQIGGY